MEEPHTKTDHIETAAIVANSINCHVRRRIKIPAPKDSDCEGARKWIRDFNELKRISAKSQQHFG